MVWSASMLRRGHAPIQAAAQLADKLYVSPIVLGELEAGFRRGRRSQENERLLRRFLASPRVEVAPVAEETVHCYAHIFDYLRRAGTPIPVNDLWTLAAAHPEHYARDGVHFNAKGIAAQADQVARSILGALK